MQVKRFQPEKFDTYLAVIQNSVGSKFFQTYYLEIDGKKVDVMRGGDLSCAFFVSAVLIMFNLSKRIHGTVASIVRDLHTSGWQRIETPKVGCIIVWESKLGARGETHAHIGFYVGQDKAISNSSKRKYPVKHHHTYGGKRKIEAIYWNSRF